MLGGDLRADGGDRGVVGQVELDDLHLAAEVADRFSVSVWLSGRPTSTRSAPACARPSATPWPSPRPAPVTTARLPDRSKGERGHSSSSATGARSVYCVFSPDIAQMKA